MNALTRFFYCEHGAVRSYLFAKGFLLLLALDTWMLMIGHAGRYGIAGFNVAHFGWLDAALPPPSSAFYIAVLVLTGLLALVMVLTGVRRSTGLLLFALYTFSWSMSMLDSYQHHYFVSLVLLCLAFFPQTSADEIHPPPPPAPASEKQQRRKQRELERHASTERQRTAYAVAMFAIAAGSWGLQSAGHGWSALLLLTAGTAVATALFTLEQRTGGPLLTSGWGYNLLGASVAIVYTYTALAKTDAAWTAGHTLLRISSVEQVFGWLAEYGERLGVERERFWSLLSTAVVPQEMALGFCYLLAVLQDRAQSAWVRIACLFGFGLALVLHLGAEAMGLEIGWFSYYMLLLAFCYLLPLALLDKLAVAVTAPARFLLRQARELEQQSPPVLWQSAALALGCGLLLAMVGYMIDLPGAVAATCVAAGVLLAVTLYAQLGPRAHDPRPYSVGTAIAACLMWVAIATSPVRWDFYRYLGGDLSRRGELRPALEIYVRGERYAPPGQSRSDKIADIRSRLERGDAQ